MTGVNLVLPTFSQLVSSWQSLSCSSEKIEDEAIEAQLRKLEETKMANKVASYKAEPIKKNIPFEDFEKLDIRVGHIIKCEKVKKRRSSCSYYRRWFGC